MSHLPQCPAADHIRLQQAVWVHARHAAKRARPRIHSSVFRLHPEAFLVVDRCEASFEVCHAAPAAHHACKLCALPGWRPGMLLHAALEGATPPCRRRAAAQAPTHAVAWHRGGLPEETERVCAGRAGGGRGPGMCAVGVLSPTHEPRCPAFRLGRRRCMGFGAHSSTRHA